MCLSYPCDGCPSRSQPIQNACPVNHVVWDVTDNMLPSAAISACLEAILRLRCKGKRGCSLVDRVVGYSYLARFCLAGYRYNIQPFLTTFRSILKFGLHNSLLRQLLCLARLGYSEASGDKQFIIQCSAAC